MKKEKLLLLKVNNKLKKASKILSAIKTISESTNFLEQNIPNVNPPVPMQMTQTPPSSTFPEVNNLINIQIEANKNNVKELDESFSDKIKKIDNLLNRIILNKSKIREIKEKISTEDSKEIMNITKKDLQLYNASLDNLLSNFDNIEMNIFNIQNFISSLSPQIEAIKNTALVSPQTIDPTQILNMKNNLSYIGKLLKNITEKIKDAEEELTLTKNNIEEYLKPRKN